MMVIQHGDAIMSGHSQSIEVGQSRKMLMHVVEPYFGRNRKYASLNAKFLQFQTFFEVADRCLPRQMQGNGTSVAGGFCHWKGV